MKIGGDLLTNNDYPRLCGGTFFTLVLQALRPRMKAREHYKGDSDGLTDPEVLAGLIQVANPDYSDPGKEVLKTPANNYKACRVSTGAYLPFDDGQMIRAFDTRVKTDYSSALAAMTSFVNSYLDLGENIGRTTALVKALVDLIQQDVTVGMAEEFYIGEHGQKKKKGRNGRPFRYLLTCISARGLALCDCKQAGQFNWTNYLRLLVSVQRSGAEKVYRRHGRRYT